MTRVGAATKKLWEELRQKLPEELCGFAIVSQPLFGGGELMKAFVATCFICAAATCVSLNGAWAQSVAEKTGVDSALGISPSTKDFVTEATIGNLFEIQSSQLALEKGDTQAKAFAQHMISDHQKAATAMKAAVEKAKVDVPVPTALDSAHQSMLDKLKGLQGADFAKQYDSDQVSAHKEAVSLFERYAKGGDNATLKSFASDTLPEFQDHLKMAENLKS